MQFLLFLLAGMIGSAVFLVGQSVQRRHGCAAAFAKLLDNELANFYKQRKEKFGRR